VKDRTSSLIRVVGLLWLASGIAAFDFDPWLRHPSTRVTNQILYPMRFFVLTLPRRDSQIVLALATAALGAAALFGPRLLKAGQAFLWLGGATTVALVFLGTQFVRPSVHFAASLLALGSTLLVPIIWLRLRPARSVAGYNINIATAVIALVLALLAGEAVFTLTPQSHAVGYTLAARLWYERYWNFGNALGYRDREHDDTSATKIFVLGDSFVRGLGLPDPGKRLSNLLQERLGPTRRVYNLGWNGVDTREEYRHLVAHPLKPNVVILVPRPRDRCP
jgi:hypothetical protein